MSRDTGVGFAASTRHSPLYLCQGSLPMPSPDAYPLEALIQDLRSLKAQRLREDRLRKAVIPLALRMAASPSLRRSDFYRCDEAQGFGSHLLHEEPDHSLAVFVDSWLPGRG